MLLSPNPELPQYRGKVPGMKDGDILGSQFRGTVGGGRAVARCGSGIDALSTALTCPITLSTSSVTSSVLRLSLPTPTDRPRA